MKVVFCTLYLGDKPTEPFIRSLTNCLPAIEALGWEHEVAIEKDCPYISAARLEVLKKALAAKADVIVFLDYDVSWTPEAMVKLLETEGDVVAGVYRVKRNDEKYMGVLETDTNGLITREDGCIKASKVPAGFLKVTALAVERFARAYPHLLIGSVLVPALDMFNHGAIDGTWYGEDYAFSKRWVDCGGDIWVVPDLDVDHNRNGVCYKGNLYNYLLNYNKPVPITTKPKVSIIIANYNYGQYIDDAIQSALDQTYPYIEVIVVDDGSTDNSLERITKYPVTCITQRNRGVAHARNVGVENSVGEWLLFLDSDDMILPTFVEECLKQPDADVVATYQRTFGDENEVHKFKDNPTYFDFTCDNQVSITSLCRRTAFEAVDGFDPKLNGMYDDWDLWIMLSKAGYEFRTIPKALFLYRKHGESLVSKAVADNERLRRILEEKHGYKRGK